MRFGERCRPKKKTESTLVVSITKNLSIPSSAILNPTHNVRHSINPEKIPHSSLQIQQARFTQFRLYTQNRQGLSLFPLQSAKSEARTKVDIQKNRVYEGGRFLPFGNLHHQRRESFQCRSPIAIYAPKAKLSSWEEQLTWDVQKVKRAG